jgi:hypothetical protein
MTKIETFDLRILDRFDKERLKLKDQYPLINYCSFSNTETIML